ncbi:MAG: TrkA C-terminal domain-containing protein [Nitrospira sp.]|nr:TrkA C-terminal domain-containing protein [Nitrospira sp.]
MYDEGTNCFIASELPELAHHLRGGTLADAAVETFRIDDDSPAQGKTLAEIALRPHTGASVIVWTHAMVTQANPSENTRLLVGDIVVLVGSRVQILQAMELLVQMGEK